MLPLVCRASSCIWASAMIAARDRTVILVHHLAGTGKEQGNTTGFTEGINESCLMGCNTESPYTESPYTESPYTE